jgi:hypothetical protein
MDTTIKELIREAQFAKTTPERLAELAAHPDHNVRRASARHGSLGDEPLAKLLGDTVWEVKVVAAHHPRAPKDRAQAIVSEMIASPETWLRALAAKSPLTPPDALVKLAKDPESDVRAEAVKNRHTPKDVARGGLTDDAPSVVLGALAHPSVTNAERRSFVTEDLLKRFFETHADGDHLFEALIERYLWDVLERAFPDPERFEDVWQELVGDHFELVEIPSRSTVLTAVHRSHWPDVIARLAREVSGGEPASA